MAEIVNLKRARKDKALRERQNEAETNRRRFGRTKAQKAADKDAEARTPPQRSTTSCWIARSPSDHLSDEPIHGPSGGRRLRLIARFLSSGLERRAAAMRLDRTRLRRSARSPVVSHYARSFERLRIADDTGPVIGDTLSGAMSRHTLIR